MGTQLRIAVQVDDRLGGFQVIDSAFLAVHRLDSVLSDWRDDSELSRLNRATPLQTVALSPGLARLLQEATEWTIATNGAFDPGIGSLVDAWDSRGLGRRPSAPELAAAKESAGLLRFELDPVGRTIRRPTAGSWIDPGGFGKGVALREARQVLERQGVGRAILDFGGQVLVMGDTTVTVEVAHPSRRNQSVARLDLRGVSASTSAQSERFIEIEGERFGHVIDPQSGIPVPAWGSVTVVHPDPAAADILSTALFVMGPERGLRWLDRRDVPALFLIQEGDQVVSRLTATMQSYATEFKRAKGE